MNRTTTAAVAACVSTVAALGVGLSTASPAQAEATPTSIELLQKCNNGTDYCVFHPNGGPQIYAGGTHQIGTTLFNCGPGSATKRVAWSDTTGETNSIGISFINAQEGGILGAVGAFKSEFEITYGHKWGSSNTTTRTTDVRVDAGQKAWLTRATPMQKITGTYELHFGYRFYGHYYWYVPFTIDGPAPNQPDVVAQHSTPMTSGEKAQCS